MGAQGQPATSGRGFLRYKPVIDDWEAFVEAIRLPMPHVIRTNTLRTDTETLRRRLLDAGVSVQRVSWLDELLEISAPPGRRIEHWLGLYYIQEAVQTLPVLALAPCPGETVLDLCAAPGGKTTFIAARMKNRGTLVANEPSGRRQMGLLSNLNRLGVLQTAVTGYRGESFPKLPVFDRVLVDAPCSAEGTVRKESSLQDGASPHQIGRLSRLQRHLLVRAFDLLAPHGTLVYSTCTFAPEENESVVTHLLEKRDARLVPMALPVSASPGLTHWEDTTYPLDMTRCVRVYPHQLNSGGGFLACIRRA